MTAPAPLDPRALRVEPPRPTAEARASGRSLVNGDVVLPALVLRDSAVARNIEAMSGYCERLGVGLAPHAKTTMTPALLRRQLDAGAWGLTVATVNQARLCAELDPPRILLANEVVQPAAARVLAGLAAHREVYCYVDSPEGLAVLADAAAAGAVEFHVLVELGAPGARTGLRADDAAVELARLVGKTHGVRLAGVAGFEGVLASDADAAGLAAVDEFASRLRAVALELAADVERDRAVVTAGGSAYFDQIVATLLPDGANAAPYEVVLRSGCYVTHDDGFYDRVAPFGTRLPDEPRLESALELWAVVQSRPDDDMAVVGFGRRDAPYDTGLPVLLAVVRDGARIAPPAGTAVTALNDQHAMVAVPPAADLRVGDTVVFGISHPCTAFDKWRSVLVVGDDGRILDAIGNWL